MKVQSAFNNAMEKMVIGALTEPLKFTMSVTGFQAASEALPAAQ
ncbi:hypothetical protein [Paenisporosarcina sp.]